MAISPLPSQGPHSGEAMRDLLFAACSYMESDILTAARLLQLVSYHANELFGISVECPQLIDHFCHACSLMRESYAPMTKLPADTIDQNQLAALHEVH